MIYKRLTKEGYKMQEDKTFTDLRKYACRGRISSCNFAVNYNRLAEYEDTGLSPKEIEALQAENAKLTEQLKNSVVLPCKVGDTVYSIQHTPNPDYTVFECVIFKIDTSIIKTGIVSYTLSCFNQFSSRKYLYFDEYKDHWFLTKQEALARLAELEAENDNT